MNIDHQLNSTNVRMLAFGKLPLPCAILPFVCYTSITDLTVIDAAAVMVMVKYLFHAQEADR